MKKLISLFIFINFLIAHLGAMTKAPLATTATYQLVVAPKETTEKLLKSPQLDGLRYFLESFNLDKAWRLKLPCFNNNAFKDTCLRMLIEYRFDAIGQWLLFGLYCSVRDLDAYKKWYGYRMSSVHQFLTEEECVYTMACNFKKDDDVTDKRLVFQITWTLPQKNSSVQKDKRSKL